MNRRLLCLSTYPARDASVRQRFVQYQPALERAGWSVTFSAIVSESLYAKKNRGGLLNNIMNAARLALGLLKRVLVLSSAGRYDVVWIHREAFPFFTPLAEEWLSIVCRGRIVLDFDDALYVDPPGGRDWRSVLRKPSHFGRSVACAAVVVCGSPALRAWAEAHNSNVREIPTCVDTRDITPKPGGDSSAGQGRVAIGWIGSWSTSSYVTLIAEALERLELSEDVEYRLCGAENLKDITSMLPRVEIVPWSVEGETTFLRQLDIGLMPVPMTQWNKGKCAYKLIQYMSAGIPFVASPVGMNVDVVRESGGGLLCQDTHEWVNALSLLVRDQATRRDLGNRGRAFAEAHFDFRSWESTVLAAVEDASRA